MSEGFHVHHIKFNKNRCLDSITQIENDVQFKLMGPDKLLVFFLYVPEMKTSNT